MGCYEGRAYRNGCGGIEAETSVESLLALLASASEDAVALLLRGLAAAHFDAACAATAAAAAAGAPATPEHVISNRTNESRL